MTCLLPHRRAVLSIALVAGPVLVAAGNLLSGDPASYSPADLVATLAELTLTLIAFLGVALVAISLLVARTVPVWVGVLLVVALVPIYLANQFGPAGNWLWLPYLAAMVACAIRLPAATAAVDERDPNSPAVSVS
jgi:hypothetical protein